MTAGQLLNPRVPRHILPNSPEGLRTRSGYDARQITSLLSLFIVSGLLFPQTAFGQSAPASFRELLRAEETRTFQAVHGYLKAHGQADDVTDAQRWFFQTAIKLSREPSAQQIAAGVLTDSAADAELRDLARQVTCVALVRDGDVNGALAGFEAALETIRLRQPEPSLQLATALVTELQIAGDPDAARKVYDQLSTAYFLNTPVRRLCAGRLQRLALVGQQVPAVTLKDLDGRDVGIPPQRVTLVDFWATNCVPCLAAFPELKRIYRRQHPRGLDVLGVSLDNDDETIRTFQRDARLQWTLVRDDKKFAQAWGGSTIPAMFLVNASGKIVACDLQISRLEAAIEKLIPHSPEN